MQVLPFASSSVMYFQRLILLSHLKHRSFLSVHLALKLVFLNYQEFHAFVIQSVLPMALLSFSMPDTPTGLRYMDLLL